MVKQEGILQERIANYLVQNYPDVLFHSDYGSGAKLSGKQSAEQKRQNGGRRAWPDMVIAEPKDVYTKPKIKTIFGKYKTKKRGTLAVIGESIHLPVFILKSKRRAKISSLKKIWITQTS